MACRLQNVPAEDYPAEFISGFNKPLRIWDVFFSFRTHIPAKCRTLLYSLFFCSEFRASIDELRVVFNGLHQLISNKYVMPHDPSDFEERCDLEDGLMTETRWPFSVDLSPSSKIRTPLQKSLGS